MAFLMRDIDINFNHLNPLKKKLEIAKQQHVLNIFLDGNLQSA